MSDETPRVHPANLSKADQAPGGLRAVAAEHKQLAWDDRVETRKYAERARALHYALGGIAVLTGALAGTAAVAKAAPLVTAPAAFASTVLVGLQTFLNRQAKANYDFSRAAGFGAISYEWEILANAPEEPTVEQCTRLIKRWEELHRPLE
jgi:hypothetical protein